jgi:opacity protein-like surface antigen
VRIKQSILSGALFPAVVSLFGIVLMVTVREADAVEYRIEPSITVSEEYNDNIYLTPLNRETDYITRALPGVHVTYNSAFWDWDATYAYDFRYFSRIQPHHQETNAANLSNITRIVEDFFFLSLRDNYSQVSLDVARNFGAQSLFVNQTDQNIVTVNPYFVMHSGARTMVTVGYLYQNIWYRDPSAIDKVGHGGYAELMHEITSKLSTTIGLRYAEETNEVQNYKRTDAYAGMNYQYEEGSSLYGTIGNIWLDAETTGKQTQLFWDAGFNHKFPKFSFSFETGLRYIEDPVRVLRREDRYVATIRREVERTAYSVTGGFVEYRHAQTNHLEETSRNVGGTITHKITTNSKISLDLSYQRLEDNVYRTYTELYLSGGKYEYLLLENLTLALEYRYTNSFSPDIFENDYYNNRFIVGIKKVF